MYFKVTKLYPNRPTEIPEKDFAKEKDALDYIQKKLTEDRHFNVNATYKLYEFSEHIRSFTQTDLEDESKGGSDSGSGSRAKGSQAFSPTPFNTAPRPGGMPHSWVKDEDKKK